MYVTLKSSTCFEHHHAHLQEEKIVLSQHLVSSFSVNGCTVCRMRADSACFVIPDCCVILIQFYFGVLILVYLFCLFCITYFERAVQYRLLSITNFNAQIPLFINNMYVTLQSTTCFEHQHAHLKEDKLYYHSIWYRHSL